MTLSFLFVSLKVLFVHGSLKTIPHLLPANRNNRKNTAQPMVSAAKAISARNAKKKTFWKLDLSLNLNFPPHFRNLTYQRDSPPFPNLFIITIVPATNAYILRNHINPSYLIFSNIDISWGNNFFIFRQLSWDMGSIIPVWGSTHVAKWSFSSSSFLGRFSFFMAPHWRQHSDFLQQKEFNSTDGICC